MALHDINVDVRIGGVLMAFSELRKTDLRQTFAKLRKPLHWDQRDHRDKQSGPLGRWQPLAKTTLDRYAREGKRRNRRILARLPNARATKFDSRQLVLYSRVRWSNAHQDGPTIVGRGARLPQRQFFWISRGMRITARDAFIMAYYRRWGQLRGLQP